ncbi:hypothetical protein [Burkholderia cepacia]|uniref:hypothetical protein n=1 Tax=Burkholderia cepacia TaxID=292 RepID=UPI001CF242FD|nr:hypothetical protein [Burkholderia cepacia]MCA8354196.1 hypothetical protein [Burkholderia cepacia]
MIKKTILGCVVALTCSSQAFACNQPTERTYVELALAIGAGDTSVINPIVSNYCINYLGDETFHESVLLASNNFAQFKALMNIALKQGNPHIYDYDVSRKELREYHENLLVSRMLLSTRTEEMKNLIKGKVKAVSEQLFPGRYNKDIPFFDEKENDKIVLYLADLYGKSYSAYVDKSYGNTPMAYAILTNRPEVVKKFFSEIDGTGALYRGNKNHVTPLHLMFSPEIKGKDMTALNDLILSNIESFKLKGIVYNGVDYFQFATINKENNMDFYNKLKKKFGFDAQVNPRTVNVVDTMALTYIDKINASWMKNKSGKREGT